MSYYHLDNKDKPEEDSPFELTLDFHGMTTAECKIVLDEIIEEGYYTHLRIIVGKGNQSPHGPVLPYFVKNYLNERNIRFSSSDKTHGDEGSIEVFLE